MLSGQTLQGGWHDGEGGFPEVLVLTPSIHLEHVPQRRACQPATRTLAPDSRDAGSCKRVMQPHHRILLLLFTRSANDSTVYLSCSLFDPFL